MTIVEPNTENLNKAIAVLIRHRDAKHDLEMDNWQDFEGRLDEAAAEEGRLCGTPCCFAGYIAVSPEFQADGGSVDLNSGEPILGNISGRLAIAEWLGITVIQSDALCWFAHYRVAYPQAAKEVRQPTFDEIIFALQALRDTGKLPGRVLIMKDLDRILKLLGLARASTLTELNPQLLSRQLELLYSEMARHKLDTSSVNTAEDIVDEALMNLSDKEKSCD